MELNADFFNGVAATIGTMLLVAVCLVGMAAYSASKEPDYNSEEE